MPDRPVAFFITFTTYGSRLHGDERGTVDRRSNQFLTAPLRRDDFRRNAERRAMNAPQFVISPDQRAAIEAAFAETCAFRGWTLMALNVRSNHVHLVLAGASEPETPLQALKANATRVLRERGLVAKEAKIWARHGSTRYLWKESDVEAAILYTAEQQGPGLPGSSPDAWSSVSRIE
jgi:REP element-mobilizing transposase RayT